MSKILICTGGTGGHIFPSIALAEYLSSLKYDVKIFTDRRAKRFIGDHSNFQISFYNLATPTGKKGLSLLFAIFLIVKSFIISIFYILFSNTKLIIGSGGYASFPTLLAARILKKKFIIYETNSILGRVSKFFLNSASKVLTGYNIEQLVPNQIYVGQLVRRKIIDLDKSQKHNELKKNFKILIIGGSQGALIFNSILPIIIKKLFSENIKLEVIHQYGKIEYFKKLEEEYRGLNVTLVEFTPNIEKFFINTDLVITRAGSSTLAELVYLKIPFITVPFKKSLDNHQFYNAKFFKDNNSCWMFDENEIHSDEFYNNLKNIIMNKSLLDEKKNNLKSLSSINTHDKFTEIIKELIR